ncbi:hypothetical protein ACVIQT_002083 [Bradyrhizobium diazoefficiens]
MRNLMVIAIGVATAGLCSCAQVPKNIGAANVRSDQIVKRVKCQLVGAIKVKANEDPRFQFLTQWAAKVHMTLIVDETGSINPGASLTEPLATAGTSFTLGVGGTFTGQAVRQEDVEFFLYFPAVFKEFSSKPVFYERYDGCAQESGLFLESDLDFRTILDRALAPVAAGTLYTGPQVGPGSSAAPPIPANEVANIRTAMRNIGSIPDIKTNRAALTASVSAQTATKLNQLLDKIQPPAITGQSIEAANVAKAAAEQKAVDIVANAPKILADTNLIITTVVNPLYDLASSTTLAPKCLSQMLSDRIQAVASAAQVAIVKTKIDDTTDPSELADLFDKETKAKETTFKHAQAMLDRIDACHEPPPKKTVAPPPQYDPIDLVQETVNFYVTVSGSVSPSWKLVRVTAPISSPFASATKKDTDTLIITLGRPDLKDGKAAASAAMNNSLQASLISQAINQRLVP